MKGGLSFIGLVIFTPVYIINTIIYLYLLRFSFGKEIQDKYNVEQKAVLDGISDQIISKCTGGSNNE